MGVNDSERVTSSSKKAKLYFWEKWASRAEDGIADKMNFYEVDDSSTIREVIRNLESKITGERLLFSEISPKNSSVKKWIERIRKIYPDRGEDIVEDLLNTFRYSLYTRSREKYKHIVGVLLLEDTMLLVHCKKDPSLAELEDKIYSVKLILHPKNVLRAAIIKNEHGRITFSAFEHNRTWSKGHAEFWGINPEDVTWDTLGSIILTVELEAFPYPIQLPVEIEQLEEIMAENRLSPTGSIRIGRTDGKVITAEVFRREMSFMEFYDYYITEQENLKGYRKKFEELINPSSTLSDDFPRENKYRYEENLQKVYEITPEGKSPIINKEHLRYTICFFTKSYPRIKPLQGFVDRLYQSIFENVQLEIWHAGEDTSLEPVTIGCLNIYNKVQINRELVDFSNILLNIIQDVASKKEKIVLQHCFCDFWKKNTRNIHVRHLFDFIKEGIIVPELKYEFAEGWIFSTEGYLEFKSADAVRTKPSKFVSDVLIPTIKRYTIDGKLTRYCILYGIEDNGEIKPLYHLKSDQITIIEDQANEGLLDERFKVKVLPIPYKEGIVLSVFIIPMIQFGNIEQKNQNSERLIS
ncbi:MAG: hypothetical protein JW878_07220 [Methanomicrobia archaeon]|nr:hypothetical protein [Methanomicrobia archaeon]